MLVNNCGSAAEQGGASGGVRYGCHTVIFDCLCATFVASLLTFSSAADSAETAGARIAVSTTLLPNTLIKKQDVLCDEPGASDRHSTSQQRLQARSCLISLPAIDKLRTQQNFNFVDVRSSAEYDKYRIAGSINIPLHLVKTKVFLKKMPVVLINDGRITTELERTCSELQREGFENVSVMDGGLFAWYANKREIEGDPFEQMKLNRMTAEELFEVRSQTNWIVIDVSTSKNKKDIQKWLPKKVITIPFKAKGDSAVKISLAISQQRKNKPQGKLLLIADDNATYERIDAKQKKTQAAFNILRLDGGLIGYREHVRKQLAMWSYQNELYKPRRYAACPG